MADTKSIPLPAEIAELFSAKVASGVFYKYAERRKIWSKETRWCRFEQLTLADLEQLVEYHRRRALAAIEEFIQTGRPYTAYAAADHIWRAERYRMRYRKLLGDESPEDFVDNDPVFPEFE